MSNMADCLQAAVSAGQLSPAHAQQAGRNYQQLVDRYEQIMPPHAAAAAAAADLKEATQRAQRARFHMVVNQLQAMRRIRHLVLTAPDPAVAIRNLLEFSEGSGFTGESVASLTEAYTGQINATLFQFLKETGQNVIGNSRNPARLEAIIRELHGDNTGDPAAASLAGAVRRAQEQMRQAFNAHGGDIGKLADFGVSHAHDAGQLRLAGYASWRDAIFDRLAWDRIDDVTTGKPFATAPGGKPTKARAERFLKDVFDSITTRGWDDKMPSMSMGGQALYNQHADHRVLHFASGADWIAYNKQFGSADPISALMNGLHGLARDVAMMRVLGPNPRAGLEYARQVAIKHAETLAASNPQVGAKLVERVKSSAKLTQIMLAHQDGSANIPGNLAWARFFGATRAVLTSIQLGSAVLSSVSDMATIAVAARVVGMHPTNIASKTASLIFNQATRETAARMGYVAEALADAGGGSARYFGKLFGTGLPERLAGFTLRATGLSFITDMRKTAFQMEFAGYLAENAPRAFADIDPSLRHIFETRGITPADWDLLRDPAHRFRAMNGADFISPFHFLETQTRIPRAEAEGLAMRLDMAIREQLEFAVPTSSLEGRARVQGGAAPGTIPGEFMRSAMSYKSFAMSLTLGQARRFMTRPTGMSKAMYFVEINAALLLMGAVAVQLKELARGNDPRPMTERKFWLAAGFQGGGLGIFGDFFAAEQSRVGGGIAETASGPVLSAIGDVLGPIASNATRAAKGEKSLLGRDVANLVRRNTPFASSAFYTRLAYDRLLADTLQRWLDPDAERLWRQQQRRQQKDYGTGTWWNRGTAAPQRAPNLSNIAGGQK